MASALSQGVAALSIGTCFYRPQTPKRVWIAAVLCSVVPDIDAIGFRSGIHYGDFWGHRGFTHSLVFVSLLEASSPFLYSGAYRLGSDASSCLPICFWQQRVIGC